MPPVSLLDRLRMETRNEHDAIERTLRLMDEDLNCEQYRQRLEQFYGFYKPVEERIFSAGSPLASWLNLQQRCKTSLLEADLATLGRPVTAHSPVCLDLPPLNNIADYFGCMYVLEGATLGGVLISRHVQAKLGVGPLAGGQFFHGYGEQTGPMWQQFRRAVTAFSLISTEHDAVVRSAGATFEALQRWCTARLVK